MLRQRLMARLGLLVAGFVAGAIIAIMLLHGLLGELDRTMASASEMIDNTQELSDAFVTLKEAADDRDMQAAADAYQTARAALARLEASGAIASHSAADELLQRADQRLDSVGEQLETGPGGAVAADVQPISALLAGARADVRELGRIVREQLAAAQLTVIGHLRWLIIGLTIAALFMLNITVIVLVRTVQMILRPVSELVDGSRLLAAEHFDHRVQIDEDDEFGELALAYNHLAEQLQTNERRRIEILRQLAVSLNHELNNVINIIELQLGMLDRRAGEDPTLSAHLRQIRAALHRISATVASLKDLRRIVLTDYVPGQKMLDLARSTGDQPFEATVTTGTRRGVKT